MKDLPWITARAAAHLDVTFHITAVRLITSAVTAYKGNQRRYLSEAISGCIAEV